jgi:hypothetical protein
MKLPNPYKCDECGVLKGESNHWWRARFSKGLFTIRAWGSVTNETKGEFHLCSESCASKAMSRAIGANTPRGKEGVE